MAVLPFFASIAEDAAAPAVTLTAREAASGILGSISLTCWVFLLVCEG